LFSITAATLYGILSIRFVLCDYQFLATPLEVFAKVPPCFLAKVYVPGFFFPICPIDSLLGLSLDFVQAKEG